MAYRPFRPLSKALRAEPGQKSIRSAVSAYLAKLDQNSHEWDEWVDAYGEAGLLRIYGVKRGCILVFPTA